MTVPIQTPQIGPTAVVQPGPNFLDIVIGAIQKRQELDQARQELEQRRAQFDLQKKLTGTQIAGMELEQEKTKRGFKAQDEDLAAQDEALRIFTGNLPTAHDMGAWGQVIANVKDPLVGQHLMGHIKDMFALQGSAGNVQATDLQNQQRILGMAEDRQIHDILQPLAGQEWNARTIARAVSRAVAVNPVKGRQVAEALGALLPDYEMVQNPNGSVSYVPKKPGQGGVVGAPLQPKPPNKEQADLGNFATRILNAHARMAELETANPGIGQRVDNQLRGLRGLGSIPIAGKPAEILGLPLILRTLGKQGREYAQARWDLGNAILRRATGQQINFEEIDRETAPYLPLHGEEGDDLSAIQQRRLTQGLTSAETAGNGFNPNRLTPSAKRLYLENLIPHPGYSPDNPYRPQPGVTVVPQ